jgi:seryl-tRNA synthetase
VSEYDREKWVEVYQAAILELKQSLMAGRIADARAEIVKRIEALREIPGQHKEERQAIEDALNSLQFLKREDVEITADDECNKAAAALERLLEIAPKRERPQKEG